MTIAVELREGSGKEFNRKLRAAGRIPGVVYGGGKDPVSVSIDPGSLDRQIKLSHAGINTLFGLQGDPAVDGRTVLVKELQREPVKGAPVHVDLFEVDQTQQIQVTVPVHLTGNAEGVVMGGVLEHALREVELLCLPSAIPDELVADVTALELGDSLHVSDLPLPAGVTLVSDEGLSVVSVIQPRGVSEEEEAEAEAAAEGAEAAAEGAETPSESGDDD